MRALLDAGADVHAEGTYGDTALSNANDQTAIVRILLEAGANVAGSRGFTALRTAVTSGNTSLVELLLDHGGADIINMQDAHGQTLLMWAADNGHTGIVKLLLDRGAAIDLRDIGDETAWRKAAANKDAALMQVLAERGAVIDADVHYCADFVQTAYDGDLDAVRGYLDSGTDVNSRGSNGDTALMMAAQQGHKDVVEFLLQRGADVFIKNRSGWTALHFANNNDDWRGIVELIGAAWDEAALQRTAANKDPVPRRRLRSAAPMSTIAMPLCRRPTTVTWMPCAIIWNPERTLTVAIALAPPP